MFNLTYDTIESTAPFFFAQLKTNKICHSNEQLIFC